MDKGVVIIALKKAAYSCGAFNLALSIKHFNPNINITLLSDGEHRRHFGVTEYSVFNNIKELPLCEYNDGSFQPGLAKLNFYQHSPYNRTLYIDADSLCLKDIGPLLDELSLSDKYIHSSVLGSGNKEDDIQYSVWATNKQIWEYFDLKDDARLNNINSSWIYVRKCKEADEFFLKLNENYKKGFGVENLLHKWGGTYPDELFYNGTLAQIQVNPYFEDKVMFFGNNLDPRSTTQIQEDYYFLTLYGKGTGVTTVKQRYIEFYDRLMFSMCENRGHEHKFKAHGMLTGKHVNR